MTDKLLESLRLPAGQRADLEAATALYQQSLGLAQGFLEGRGLSEESAISLRLGVVSEPYSQDHQRFVGMLCIPYLSPAGVLGVKFRQLNPSATPKYDSPSGQRARLYNVAALHSPGDTVAVCEGELDAAVMTHVVGIPAVGIPGASHWQDWWSRCFSDYDRVLVVADHDIREEGAKNPGIAHAERVVKEIGSAARLVMPPAGLDVCEWVAAAGADAVRSVCNG